MIKTRRRPRPACCRLLDTTVHALDRSRRALVVVIACVGLGPGAHAGASLAPSVQDEEPSGEVALLAGGALHDKELVGGTDPQAELGPVLGLRGGYRLSDRYRLFADATASRFDIAWPDSASALALRFGFEVFPRSARWGRWSPFSSFGFGWLKAEDTPPGDLSRPLVTAGFGQRRAGGGGNAWLWTARLDRTLGDADLPGRQRT